MRLYLLRHCESIGNELKINDDNSLAAKNHISLSKKGKEQAKELALKLKEYQFDVIFASPFLRVKQTLEPYLEINPKHQPIFTEMLVERNCGVFVGKPWEAMENYWKENNIVDKVSFKPEEGESLLDVYGRASEFLNYLKKNFADKKILICGHSAFLRCMNILLKDGDIKKYYSSEKFGNGEIKEYTL